jgi:hypothetical protein
MKYLTAEQLQAALSSQKAIGQWLPSTLLKNYSILRWLRIDKINGPRYILQYIECFDEGNNNFIDVYDFSPINPDIPLKQDSFRSIENALNFAEEKYNAALNRFLLGGLIQEEYRNYLNSKF